MSGEHKTVIKGSPSHYVKLNVGGSLYYTTIGTLTKSESALKRMFSGQTEVVTDAEGWVLVDRCGKHFGTILNFLRNATVPLPECHEDLGELLAEADHFSLEQLADVCRSALADRRRDVERICRVPLIASDREARLLLDSTPRPLVKLLVNRHNNKYSYTSASDDNFLRNIELFDKLSLRFSGRVLFVKDLTGSDGSEEICCWSFYGRGEMRAVVCCTSIVYGQDKKHTKVDFPEARIYEETLGVLLYEDKAALPN